MTEDQKEYKVDINNLPDHHPPVPYWWGELETTKARIADLEKQMESFKNMQQALRAIQDLPTPPAPVESRADFRNYVDAVRRLAEAGLEEPSQSDPPRDIGECHLFKRCVEHQGYCGSSVCPLPQRRKKGDPRAANRKPRAGKENGTGAG